MSKNGKEWLNGVVKHFYRLSYGGIVSIWRAYSSMDTWRITTALSWMVD
ncbi:MAG: hypothetical protein ACLU3F_00105 [Blautia wexlerae]